MDTWGPIPKFRPIQWFVDSWVPPLKLRTDSAVRGYPGSPPKFRPIQWFMDSLICSKRWFLLKITIDNINKGHSGSSTWSQLYGQFPDLHVVFFGTRIRLPEMNSEDDFSRFDTHINPFIYSRVTPGRFYINRKFWSDHHVTDHMIIYSRHQRQTGTRYKKPFVNTWSQFWEIYDRNFSHKISLGEF